MKKIAFIFVGFVSILAYLIGNSLISGLSNNIYLQVFYWIIHIIMISILASAPFISRLIPKANAGFIYRSFQWAAYHLMGFYFILLFFIVVKSPFQLFFGSEIINSVGSIGVVLMSIVLTGVGFWTTIKEPTVIKVQIKIDELPKKFTGFKIIQFSDVHVSHTIKSKFISKIVEISNSNRPDIVVLTGDIVDGNVAELASEISPFGELKSKHGVFYIPGNHEYYWNLESWLIEFKKLPINILINSSKEIKIDDEKIIIAGVHDLAAGHVNPIYKCDPIRAFENTPVDVTRILLAHQPKIINTLGNLKVDLVLSGHTHAGQFFPATLFIKFFQPYVKGLHRIQNRWLYINQGTGYWGPPNKLGTKSEITLIELV